MTDTQLISVIIPCYNLESFVGEAVDSALGQTHREIEVIVVDDGSIDRSPHVVRERSHDPRLHFIQQENGGVSSARNRGILASRGQYLAFLDADDYWDVNLAEKLLAGLHRADAGLAYCGWQNIGLSGPKGESFVPPDYEADPDKLAKLVESTRWPIHAAIVRRELVEWAGCFDPRWPPCEDFGLWVRVATKTRVALVP